MDKYEEMALECMKKCGISIGCPARIAVETTLRFADAERDDVRRLCSNDCPLYAWHKETCETCKHLNPTNGVCIPLSPFSPGEITSTFFCGFYGRRIKEVE